MTEDEPPGHEPNAGLQKVIDAIVAAERVVSARSGRGEIDTVCMRFAAFHGQYADSTRQMFDMVRRRRLPIIGQGDTVRSWIDVEDAARAVALALESAPGGTVVYNVADDEPVAMRDYIGEIVRLTDAKPPMRLPYWLMSAGASFVAPAFGRGRLPISNAKLKRELGWTPRYPTYRDSLRAVVGQPAAH